MNNSKTRHTTALLDLGSWFIGQTRRPVCWLFGHDYWLSLDYQIIGVHHLFQCRRCDHSYFMQEMKYDVFKTMDIISRREIAKVEKV